MMSSGQRKAHEALGWVAIIVLLVVFGAGCATTPAVGSRTWHEQRISEIESAYAQGKIGTEAYLSLKNDADAIRQAYAESLRRPPYYEPFYSPFLHPFDHRPFPPH